MKKNIILALSLGILYPAFQLYQYFWYLNFIPNKIIVLSPVNISGQSNLDCGSAIFRLTDTSAKTISREGLGFFEDARYSRDSQKNYYTYKAWAETPVPESWVSEGSWVGLSCSSASNDLKQEIIDAAKQKGSYYTVKSEGKLLVIPALKMIVFSYFG